jgi:transcriptional regulator with XRE-family HTH domain
MLSDKILELRLSNNWTQAELAKRSGVKQPLIAGYEHGKKPSKKTLEKLAIGFGIPLKDFLKIGSKRTKVDRAEVVDVANVLKQVMTLPLKYQIVVKEDVLRLLSLHQFEQDQKRLESMILKRKSPQEKSQEKFD